MAVAIGTSYGIMMIRAILCDISTVDISGTGVCLRIEAASQGSRPWQIRPDTRDTVFQEVYLQSKQLFRSARPGWTWVATRL